VDNHPDLFEGVTEAISEVGGFSVSVGDQRLYALQTAEKGLAWMRLIAKGTAGHGSMIHNDNAVTELAEAIARIGRHEWPLRLPAATRAFLEAASEALGIEFNEEDLPGIIGKLGGMSKMLGATVKNTANPTRLDAGYKVNVIPQSATAEIDGRFLPGHEDEFFAEIDRLIGGAVKREFIHHDIALETTPDGDLYDAMSAALLAEDPDARVVPYCLSGGTDAKSFSRLGMRCFGFSPLKLPSDLDFFGMFHGIDERVPLDGLRFGVRVFDRLLSNC
jgi:acetylornithine deacetylase/succinyl-diaminopimelate desuccinylase-like protein